MISEERIKGLAKAAANSVGLVYNSSIEAIAIQMRTVAAEAREEGIEEAAKAIECDGPWTLLGAIARVNALKGKP